MSLKLLTRKLRAELAKRAASRPHKAECIILYAGEQAPEGTPEIAYVVHTTTPRNKPNTVKVSQDGSGRLGRT